MRRQRRDVELEVSLLESVANPFETDPEDLTSERADRLREALHLLKPEERAILRMRFWHNWSIGQIAQRSGITYSAAAVRQFIDTGEAQPEFLTYLDEDKDGQEPVEMAFNAQAEAFHGLAEELKKPGPISVEATVVMESAAASGNLAHAVGVIVNLPPAQRIEAVRQTASVLKSSLEPEQQKSAYSVIQKLSSALSRDKVETTA